VEINEIALKTLEGHVRGVCATLTIEQINSERDAMASKILTMAGEDLKNMGIEIRSFVIKEIEDEHGYLDALGIKRTEEVKRDARIGKANANREATIAEAIAAQQAEKANADAEAQVAQFHRDRDVIRFKAESEVETERSNREISFQMQTARRNQELVVEQTKIDIRQKEQQVLVQTQEVLRRQQEQAADQVVPAKAKADAVAAEADGEKRRLVTTARRSGSPASPKARRSGSDRRGPRRRTSSGSRARRMRTRSRRPVSRRRRRCGRRRRRGSSTGRPRSRR
jgi:flotillin